MLHRRLVYIYLLNVPSTSSRYFNKIKRTSRLGRSLALSLEILVGEVTTLKKMQSCYRPRLTIAKNRRNLNIYVELVYNQFEGLGFLVKKK